MEKIYPQDVQDAMQQMIDWKNRCVLAALTPVRNTLFRLVRRVQELENPLNVVSEEQLRALEVLNANKSTWFTDKEMAFIIEALRYWQRDMDDPQFVSALTEKQIDELCERLNLS